MRIRKAVLDGVFILGTPILFFAVCEATLRSIYPDRSFTYPEQTMGTDAVYHYNDAYIVSIKPNIKGSFTRQDVQGNGRVVEWTTNANSFRGPELREHHEFRIIVYGDSNIQACFSDLQDTFPYRLEEYLRRATAKDVEVINAGVVGFGPDQSLIRFVQEADIFKPDMVIVHIFADNDFGDIIRNRLFELNSSGELVTPGLRTKFSAFLSGLVITKATHKVLRMASLEKQPGDQETYTRELDTTARLLDVNEREYALYERKHSRMYSNFSDHYDIDLALYPEDKSSRTKIKLMDVILANAKTVADSKHIEFMVVIQPSSRDLTACRQPNYLEFSKYAGYRRDNLTAAVDDICDKHDIPRVNLYDVFLQNNPDSLFIMMDSHWNEKGQDIAAEKVADYVSKYVLSH